MWKFSILYLQVLGKDLFKVLKEKWCAILNSFISEKISPWRHLLIRSILHIYDVAFGFNSLGTMHVVNFAKKCFKIKVLVHVSTVDGTSGLVIDVEKKVVKQGLNELIAEGASEKEIKLAMTHLGIKIQEMYGWPNTYVFTKAIGEMLIQHLEREYIYDYNWQNTLCCQYFEGMLTGRRRKTNFVMPLVEIYGPHLLSNATFDDRNTEKLRMATRENMMETDIFSFILSALIGKITS
ncbi:Fatty acyl-CoA reductase 3 [Citrus sinensis]|uniref:Fatty acyl-CoA reductase 3 n=1 Tax=Citrus sinensis TaxID=2711 RepID=A0ACB8IU36_CITSI|nr:Fatty acyl-CoA reductase 3 [Citrus sinensis]